MPVDTAHGKRTYSERLASIAAPLKPAKPPWYQRRVPVGLEEQFPAEGWYWIPNGHPVAVFLARDSRIAEHKLRNLLDRALEADQ